MPSTAIDSELFRDQFSTPEMRVVFSDLKTLQGWLDVEVALAKAEAELGIIPTEAAWAINEAGDAFMYDLAELKAGIDITAHPIVPLVRAISEKCPHGLGEFVHWGATTQDIIDTGLVLQLRNAWTLIHERLESMIEILTDISLEHAETAMAGRTHGQHAQPVTLGYKTAVWLDEARRNLDRLDECRPRLLVGQFGGAVGTLASLGEQGLAVRAGVMRELGLAEPAITWHTARDRFVEFVAILGLIGGLCGKIGNEVYALQRTEFAELEEPYPDGKIGSSTMPHKRNPAICESVVALSRLIRATVGTAMETLIAEHERDKIGQHTERDLLARACCHADAALLKTAEILQGMTVRTDNMRDNLEITRGLTLSEAVMMALADKIGRQHAHHLLNEACMAAFQGGTSMREALARIPEVRENLSDDEIEALMDPEAYTGLAARMARDVAAG
ncbi:MAG: adenylosuccinate lyase [Proteobacteria bacterium]|nr:adenylosuccinate lyase [Pseudomonadota bacterium]